MTVSLHLFIATVCVTASVVLADLCDTESYGDLSELPTYFGKFILTPGIFDWKININAPYYCNGVILNSCDYDVTPEIEFIDMNTAYVHRRGEALLDAVVMVTVLCYDNPLSDTNKSDMDIWQESGFIVVPK